MKVVRALTIPLILVVLIIPGWTGEPSDEPPKTPNLLVDVSDALINAAVQRTVDQTDRMQEIIQDTPVSGLGRTLGAVRTELVPDPGHAVVDVIFQGTVFARAVGQQRTILIHTFTTTQLDVRRRIIIDGNGIQILPGPPCAQSTTEMLGINSQMDMDVMAIRLAHRFYHQRKQAGEAETAAKTAWRASHRLEEDLSPGLASASKAIGRELVAIKRAGLSLESLDFTTTSAALQVRLRIATPGRVEPNAIPALPARTDLGVRIHESLVNEALQAELGGTSFALNGLSKFYDEVTRGLVRDGRKETEQKDDLKKIEKLVADLAGKPVTIALAMKDPVTVGFAGQGFSVEIHIASVRRGATAYAGGRGKARYQLENSKAGVRAVRQGAVKIVADPAQPEKKLAALPPEFLLLKEAILAEVLKERLTLGPLPMPDAFARMRLEAPRADARQGWFTLAWALAEK